MLKGMLNKLSYYLSITNGNGKASDNLTEDNNFKDLQIRLDYKLTDVILFGASFNLANEAAQELKLANHSFENFNTAKINGKRNGFLGHIEYLKEDILLRGELFTYKFEGDLSADQQVGKFIGGYGELGYFISGNNNNGLQLIGRFETAQYDNVHSSLIGTTSLNSYLFGPNIYLDGIFRLQLNVIYEKANSPSVLRGRFDGKYNDLVFLTMLQIKF